VSSNVLIKVMQARIRRPEETQELEAEGLERHMQQLAGAIASHGGESKPLSSPGLAAPPPEEPAVLAEQECPCGSGKKFSECHGADLDGDGQDSASA
jgi:preprotein translocase subunit SecA